MLINLVVNDTLRMDEFEKFDKEEFLLDDPEEDTDETEETEEEEEKTDAAEDEEAL